MATKNDENWMMHYNELKVYVAVHHHFPDKHKVEFCGLYNWAKIPERRSKQTLYQKSKDCCLRIWKHVVNRAFWRKKEENSTKNQLIKLIKIQCVCSEKIQT